MWLFTKDMNGTIYIFAQVLTYISYIFLFEFGRRLIVISNRNFDWRILPIVYTSIIVVCLLFDNFWVSLDILIGYFIRFPAGIMSGVGFFLYYKSEKKKLSLLNVKKYFYLTGIFLLLWSFFCGIVRSRGDFFPANIIYVESFFLAVNIPVYVFRSISGLIIAWSLIHILKIFNIEKERKIKESENKYHEAFNLVNFYKDLLTHDMNNILQIMISSADFYSKHQNNPEKLKKLGNIAEIIEKQAKRGASLILHVRLLSKLDETEVELSPIEIYTVLDKSVENTINSFRTKNVKIKVNGLSKDMKILSDELLINIFDNILNNAVKYNDNEEEIRVEVNITKIVEEGIKYLKLEFIDYGIGVSDDRKKTIFDKSYTKDLTKLGMGMGLSLVKKIIDKYGGNLLVEDRVKGDYKKGSNFVVMLKEA